MLAPTIAPATTFVIVATSYIVPPPRMHGTPYWEIFAGPDQESGAALVRLITRDPELIVRALEIEGTDARVSLRWARHAGANVLRGIW